MKQGYHVIRYPKKKHECPPIQSPIGMDGAIFECISCGRWWRAVEPGNPDYAGWKRARFREFFSDRRRKHRETV